MKNFKKLTGFLLQGQGRTRTRITEDKDYRDAMAIVKNVNFSFPEGFSDRLMFKLNRILESDPINIYYINLSRFFPKIIGFSFAAIILMGLILYALHGSLSPDKFVGADRIDENNFISYLILEK